MPKPPATRIQTHPLTPGRWRDFAALMNSRFDLRHCWCMWPRLATNYKHRTGEQNRRSIKRVVDTAAAPPGVLAYVDGVVAGWCAVAPREEFPKLDRSRATAAIDHQPVWSVVCFYVPRRMRRKGVSQALLAAAVALATQHGATIIEGYPVDRTRNVFRGLRGVYEDAGFREARRTGKQAVLRYRTRESRKPARSSSAKSASSADRRPTKRAGPPASAVRAHPSS